MTRQEFRKLAQNAVKQTYGFDITLKSIKLYATDDEGKYIAFRVGDKDYELLDYEYLNKLPELWHEDIL